MDVIKVKDNIENLIGELQELKVQLAPKARLKAQSIAEYDKDLAITIIKLKNGVSFKLEDVEIVNPPATLTEKIAKGICHKQCCEMNVAEGEYKSLISRIEVTQSQLNGFQSINRHLE